mmetsp:Transcript_43640/g.115219  ORF Transcript_43640/g.115219 Transcript_43640/m.115219 type:complete len:647 (-) Transcript_43640:2162-4102(-)
MAAWLRPLADWQEEEAAAAWGGGAPGPLTAAAETPEAPTVRMGRGAQRDRMSIAGAQQHGRGSTAGRAFIGAAPVDAWLAGQLAADEGAAVPPWVEQRMKASAESVRQAAGNLRGALGRRPELHELRSNAPAAAAMEKLEKLRAMRDTVVEELAAKAAGSAATNSRVHAEGELWGEVILLGGGATARARRNEGDEGTHGGGVYSTELLRVRHMLSKADLSRSSDDAHRAAQLLHALRRRATTEAATLTPPVLLPGATLNADLDPVQARYIWLRERAQRMGALAARSEMAALAQRHVVDELLAELATEEARERLCEAGRWTQLLSEWQQQQQQGQRQQQPSCGVASASSDAHGATPLMALPIKLPFWGGTAGGGRERRIADQERRWLESIGREHALLPQAKERAAGVMEAMLARGYRSCQCRAVLMGMVVGSRQKLTEAWRVFVPAHSREQYLGRAEWREVLGLLTAGLGIDPAQHERLFTMFDADGSGQLDFDEFCQVLAALPLQQSLEDAPLGRMLNACQSMLLLHGDLSSKLTIEQLASAGRVMASLRGAGFDNEQAATVVEALFLSRSRPHLRVAWGVLLVALADDVHSGQALADGVVRSTDFARLMPLLGEVPPPPLTLATGRQRKRPPLPTMPQACCARAT